jgi:hypothetical protein
LATRDFFSRYIDVPNSALFPFGYGLSYSSFSYHDVKVSRAASRWRRPLANRMHPSLEATATVTNTGERTATEVVQCYVRNLGASIEQPVRSLKGFERVTLGSWRIEAGQLPSGLQRTLLLQPGELSHHRSDPLHGLDRRQFAGQPGSHFEVVSSTQKADRR